MTARKKTKNQAPTYWPSVVGMKELVKIMVAVLAVLKIIIVLAAMDMAPALDVDIVIPDSVELDMAAMVVAVDMEDAMEDMGIEDGNGRDSGYDR